MPEDNYVVLTVAHDVVCPWCWVGRKQAAKLRTEFPYLSFRWVGYELLPEGLPYTPAPPAPDADRKPAVPSRFSLLLAADRLVLPHRNSQLSNSRKALEGAEYAADRGAQEEYLDALYHAYWEEDRDIDDMAVLRNIAQTANLDVIGFENALRSGTYSDRIVEFDDDAHANGIWNVPTWMYPGNWVAEQPYTVLKEMTMDFLNT